MVNLLQLPREIRDHIFDSLLRDSNQFLPSVLHAKKWNTRRDLEDPTATKIFHSSLPLNANVFDNLMLTNRQLNDEVQQLLRRDKKYTLSQAHLELDLLLEDLTTYYATWLRVLPYSGSVVKTVRFQIRTFFVLRDGRDLLPQDMSTASMDPDAASYAVTWRLGAVINNLLCCGPTCAVSAYRRKAAKSFIIQDLIVEVVRPKPVLSSTDSNDIERTRIATGHAEYLEGFLVRRLEEMLSGRTGNYLVPWGPLTLSRIRRLSILSNGSALKVFDLAARANALGIPLVLPEYSTPVPN